eukprot:gnl/MRDRNA2_/MRDRNA2_70984_c0_seq3.p1 gnl/MRDRNA2_/MRDRNA2_70984_c0~~gnl/MRDRNA2_/MRDRNA2_70984_c0_seq3.p1  ORF type:complete len:267 (-),score=48.82 gnl/MRDRNA2_/MRDRNA2_70984_c0_seq3:38-781(-)
MATEPDAKRPRLNFSEESEDGGPAQVAIDPKIAQYAMTASNRKLLSEQCGMRLVTWDASSGMASLYGSAEQVKACARVIARVASHCSWGISEDKVSRIIKPRKVEAVVIRLAPLIETLPSFEKRLTTAIRQLTIGKEKGTNDLAIPDATISRQHCILEFDVSKGAVYIVDSSTNGTFLNGTRLPAKMSGKVILSHGDEILFKDSISNPEQDFGWMVNIDERIVKEEVNLTSHVPRRIIPPPTYVNPK